MELFALEEVIHQCQAKLALADTDAARLPCLLELAWHLRQRDSARARRLCEQVQVLLGVSAASLPAEKHLSYAARRILIVAECAWLFGQLTLAHEEAQQALQQFDKLADQIGVADSHWLLAHICSEQGMIDAFDLHMQQACQAAQLAVDQLRYQAALALRASWAGFRDLPKALAEWGPIFAHDYSQCHPCLAACISDYHFTTAALSSDFGSAIECGMRTHTWAMQSGQIRSAIISATNVGDVFNSLNDTESALEWMQIGLDLARAAGWPARIAGCLAQTGETLRKLGRLEAASDMLKQSLQILAVLSGSRSYALTLHY